MIAALVLVPAAGAGPAAAVPAPVPTVVVPSHPGPLTVTGVGGFEGQRPITIPAGTISPLHPLRVMMIGDSVMSDAELG
ncbi:MAG: hypothetical protein ACLPVF_20405, partial [Acidimicrobiales bacterium]